MPALCSADKDKNKWQATQKRIETSNSLTILGRKKKRRVRESLSGRRTYCQGMLRENGEKNAGDGSSTKKSSIPVGLARDQVVESIRGRKKSSLGGGEKKAPTSAVSLVQLKGEGFFEKNRTLLQKKARVSYLRKEEWFLAQMNTRNGGRIGDPAGRLLKEEKKKDCFKG